MIKVTKIDNNTFNVEVSESSLTNHQVTLTDEYHLKLTSGRLLKEELIKMSFEFLLERESNTMILREFDLPVIQRYFGEYEGCVKRET